MLPHFQVARFSAQDGASSEEGGWLLAPSPLLISPVTQALSTPQSPGDQGKQQAQGREPLIPGHQEDGDSLS